MPKIILKTAEGRKSLDELKDVDFPLKATITNLTAFQHLWPTLSDEPIAPKDTKGKDTLKVEFRSHTQMLRFATDVLEFGALYKLEEVVAITFDLKTTKSDTSKSAKPSETVQEVAVNLEVTDKPTAGGKPTK